MEEGENQQSEVSGQKSDVSERRGVPPQSSRLKVAGGRLKAEDRTAFSAIRLALRHNK
jgi:hypothetical protein